MKKYIYFILAAAVSFAACDSDNGKNDDNDNGNGGGITATASNVTEYTSAADVKYVKAVAWTDEDGGGYASFRRISNKLAGTRSSAPADVIAVTTYSNKGFSIKLPDSYPTEKMSSVDEDFGYEGITINPSGVKVGTVDFEGHSTNSTTWSDTDYIDDFYYETEDYQYGAFYAYFDKDVTVSGSATNDDFVMTVNINAKKGWNVVYMYEKNDSTEGAYTTTKPSGINLRWVFGYDEK